MSRSRVLQGLLLYLISQTKESPPFSLYCFSPYKAVAAPRCRTSPSMWPGGAPLSPGRSVFMPLASSNPPRQCMEPAPTQRQSGRAAEPPPEPSPSHVPRCERAISPTYAAKPGLTCTAACRFLCRTASDQARRASGRWPKGASEPPASFRGAGRPELCQSRFNSERQPMCCKNAGLAVPARSGGAFRGGADFVMGAILRPTRPRPAEPASRETTAEGRATASLSANGIPTASPDAHKHFM